MPGTKGSRVIESEDTEDNISSSDVTQFGYIATVAPGKDYDNDVDMGHMIILDDAVYTEKWYAYRAHVMAAIDKVSLYISLSDINITNVDQLINALGTELMDEENEKWLTDSKYDILYTFMKTAKSAVQNNDHDDQLAWERMYSGMNLGDTKYELRNVYRVILINSSDIENPYYYIVGTVTSGYDILEGNITTMSAYQKDSTGYSLFLLHVVLNAALMTMVDFHGSKPYVSHNKSLQSLSAYNLRELADADASSSDKAVQNMFKPLVDIMRIRDYSKKGITNAIFKIIDFIENDLVKEIYGDDFDVYAPETRIKVLCVRLCSE